MNRNTRIRVFALTLCLLLLAGCAAKQTPQYNAAVVSNDFAHSMGGLQTEEYALVQSKVIDQTGHARFKTAALQINQWGKQADALIAVGDWQGAIPLLTSALGQLRDLTPAVLGIKDANSQLLYSASLNAALAVLEINLSNSQSKAAGGAR